MREILPDSAGFVEGRLQIGGCDAGDLAENFGTPLVVLDRATIEARATAFAAALEGERVYYAAKALSCVALFELLGELGLGLDVCSGGELATALAAGFPPERIIFHGNNKSIGELELAKRSSVGRVVIDSLEEISRIREVGLSTKLLIRVTPGVEAHTHEFVQTGQEDSKFGFGLQGDLAFEAVRSALQIEGCRVVGLHSHIGSQIFELSAFELAAQRVADFARRLRDELDLTIEEINLGGGLGIAHTRDEMTPEPKSSVEQIVAAASRRFAAAGLEAPLFSIEPGRALIGAAGVSLYTVGTVKAIPGVRTFVAIDGGMSDNLRPALYGARYEAFLALRAEAPSGPRVTVCGKHCESGDVLISEVHLPADTAVGDLLCIPATGAYTYSMASNYNRIARPAVVLVSEGEAIPIVTRESEADLLARDRHLDGSALS